MSRTLFTISGLVWATLALFAILNNNTPMMWLWLVIALIVDGVDGTLARKVGVREAIPWFDGGVVDNLVDYLTWTFLPALFMALHLPFGAQPMPVIMMIVIMPSEKPETLTINGLTKLNHANTPALPNMVAAKISQGSGFFRNWNCSVSLISDLS